MDAKLKLILTIVVVLIGSVILALTAADSQYVVSSILFLVLCGLVVYLFLIVLHGRYQVLRVRYDYEFLDAEASDTTISKSTVLVPRVKTVTEVEDHSIGPDGKISLVSANNGTTTVRKEGDTACATTVFDTALTLGQEYMHVLSYHGKDCFPRKSETIVHSAMHKIDEAIVRIKFHEEKRPLNFKVIKRLGIKTEDITSNYVEIDDLTYIFTYTNPPRGSTFEIDWEW